MQNRKQSELSVITKAKDLCSYILTVTEKSPKAQIIIDKGQG